MSDWREGYRKALIDLILSEGNFMATDPGPYGWWDRDADWTHREHPKFVHPDAEITEKYYSEFVGTFEANKEITLLVVSAVSCDCEQIIRRPYAYAATIGDVLSHLLKEN